MDYEIVLNITWLWYVFSIGSHIATVVCDVAITCDRFREVEESRVADAFALEKRSTGSLNLLVYLKKNYNNRQLVACILGKGNATRDSGIQKFKSCDFE